MIIKINRKSLLYKSKVEFEDYALNHIEGCTHGCNFPCYARLIKKRTPQDWQKISIVGNSLELLDKEIPKLKDKIKQVHLCFTTDVFMYRQPEVIRLSLEIIKKLMENGIKIKTLTKGKIPSLYIISLETASNIKKITNEYGITLVSLDEDYRKKYEPHTAPFEERTKALKTLAAAGLYTYVYCEPFNPTLTSLEDFKKLLDKTVFVKKIYFGSWQYNAAFRNKKNYGEYINTLRSFCAENGIEPKLKKELAQYA